jgi:hypothetical protein
MDGVRNHPHPVLFFLWLFLRTRLCENEGDSKDEAYGTMDDISPASLLRHHDRSLEPSRIDLG